MRFDDKLQKRKIYSQRSSSIHRFNRRGLVSKSPKKSDGQKDEFGL